MNGVRELPPKTVAILVRTIRNAPQAPNRVVAARTVARGTTIVGMMMQHLAQRYRLLNQPAAWLLRAGRAAWGVVEAATPRGFWELMFQYWIWLAYALAAAVLLLAAVTGAAGMTRTGVLLLLAVVAAHTCVGGLNSWMTYGRPVRRVLLGVAAVCTVGAGLCVYRMNVLDGEIQQDGGHPQMSRNAGLLISPADVDKYLGADAAQRQRNVERMRESLLVDFAFIACYTGLLVSLAGLFASIAWPKAGTAVSLVAAVVIAGALCDILENAQAYLALGSGLHVSGAKLWLVGVAFVLDVILGLLAWGARKHPARA
jgi:hypothetical protein